MQLILGIESSCDETGVALVRVPAGGGLPQLLAHGLHSQIEMHRAYGGVVPELASRDHIRRVLPLTEQVLADAQVALADLDVVAFKTNCTISTNNPNFLFHKNPYKF